MHRAGEAGTRLARQPGRWPAKQSGPPAQESSSTNLYNMFSTIGLTFMFLVKYCNHNSPGWRHGLAARWRAGGQGLRSGRGLLRRALLRASLPLLSHPPLPPSTSPPSIPLHPSLPPFLSIPPLMHSESKALSTLCIW